MSDTRWTDEQLQAIKQRDCNLLVAAAAGAGKTAVLVERIISKITDSKNPVDIDRLLVVTFTNAAAAEMRERIGNAIIKLLNTSADQENLKRQLTLLTRANITTIHSFCLDVIKNNFHQLDVDPGFRIADETETTLIKMEALEELFEDKYEAEDDPEFLRLVECYGGHIDDRRLGEMVLELFEFTRSCPWPEEWLKEQCEAFNLPEGVDFSTTKWAKSLLTMLKIELSGMIESLNRAKAICSEFELFPYLECIEQDIAAVRELYKRASDSWDQLIASFSGFELVKLARCKKDADRKAQESVRDIRDKVKARLKTLKDDIFNASTEDLRKSLTVLYPMLGCLSSLVMDLSRRYQEKKKEKGLLDFGDLEHLCLKILASRDDSGKITPSETAKRYREYYEEILVDEYQDSNNIQELILNMISDATAGPYIFMVGDVKQSIYRFRQAKPELFLQKYNNYPMEPGESSRKILLYKNFRSRKEILDGVNFIFRQLMSCNIGELDYTEKEALNCGLEQKEEDNGLNIDRSVEIHIVTELLPPQETNSTSNEFKPEVAGQEGNVSENTVHAGRIQAKGQGYPANPAQIQAIQKQHLESPDQDDSSSGTPDQEDIPDKIQAEARMVAARICELVLGENPHLVWDKKLGNYRPVQYRDIVILLRATKNWSDIFTEELTAHNIPCYADTGTGFFRTTEIETIMSLLMIIDNPLQDIPLIAVLRSQIAGFTPDELVRIRNMDKNSSFYNAMCLAREGCDELSLKVSDFLNRLEGWRKKSLYLNTDELLWHLYTDTGYYSYAALMPGGAQRQGNLDILLERARQFEKTSYRGLFNFINFIDKLKSRQGDMGSAKILGENENVVRIMSIHKSKGLEFPVVFVSGCGKQFNMQDTAKSILVHQELGFGPDFIDPEKRIAYPTVAKHSIQSKLKFETLSEEMRILYVAFTRASEKLIITASVADIEKACAKWSSVIGTRNIQLPEFEVLQSRRYIDWICLSAIRHKEMRQLREIAGKDLPACLIDDGSKWSFRLWNSSCLTQASEKFSESGREIIDEINSLKGARSEGQYSNIINDRLCWNYKYAELSTIPAKMTVTELKRRLNAELDESNSTNLFYTPRLIKRPAFMERATAKTPAEKGTILHFVMQHLDLLNSSSRKDIEVQLDMMVEKELLAKEDLEVVDVYKILEFINSPLGKRIRNSSVVKREIPFNMELPVEAIRKVLKKEIESDETILLQGVIDLFFEEDGELVLVDYKTDYVPAGETDTFKEKYKVQMEYYKKALEKLTGKKVKESYIYLFWNNDTIAY
ncbi:MAG TPA: helicase-exonuclease AddAB subunit AddA [Clostridiaceae bacterium]|nr:helicase-exonuclease AddAB subunit AddA [Clostridiaceae bacterium]